MGIAYSDKLKGQHFIEFLRERLVLLKDLLSEQGSIYLHIDYKIGHLCQSNDDYINMNNELN